MLFLFLLLDILLFYIIGELQILLIGCLGSNDRLRKLLALFFLDEYGCVKHLGFGSLLDNFNLVLFRHHRKL